MLLSNASKFRKSGEQDLERWLLEMNPEQKGPSASRKLSLANRFDSCQATLTAQADLSFILYSEPRPGGSVVSMSDP